MNKRILEIAKQAGFGLHRDGEIYTSRLEHLPITEDIEKLAELLIRECAEVVDNDDSSYPYDSFGHKLKQHFGVQ